MKLQQISPNAYRLTRFRLFNSYLVRESDGYTLIDTGIPGSAERFIEAARQQKVGQICRILLTHAHGDHIGSVDRLCHLLGNASVAIGQREARLLPKKPAQDRSLDPGEPQCKVKGSYPGATSSATHLLTDGELYGSLRCIATPGHTPGHFSYLDERDGTLYAGDALVTVRGKTRVSGWAPWYFPLPNFATWHRPTAKASVQRLLDMPLATPIRRIAAGHGQPVEGGREVIEAALKVARL